MSANKTNLELLLEIYAGVKDGQFDLSHDPKDKWRIAIVQLWKNSYERVIAHGVGGTVEDAAAAACEDYYDRIDKESCFDGPHDASFSPA